MIAAAAPAVVDVAVAVAVAVAVLLLLLLLLLLLQLLLLLLLLLLLHVTFTITNQEQDTHALTSITSNSGHVIFSGHACQVGPFWTGADQRFSVMQKSARISCRYLDVCSLGEWT